jgi:DNA replication protein DnaC
MIKQAHIPERYAHCVLSEYVSQFPGANRSLAAALVQAQNFVKAYPFGTAGNGLLLTGSIGVGKTHLAVGILRELIAQRGAKGLFVDYRELLKELQNSYSRNVDATELGILQPVFDAEVLVLDELGASKPSEWVGDTIGTILNGRYNRKLTTIVTTNYANLPPAGALKDAAKAAIREDTLGDRIGERIRSRLQEMCVVVQMEGDDFRQTVKRASFS